MIDANMLALNQWVRSIQKPLKLKIYQRYWELPAKDLVPTYYSCAYLTYKDKTQFGLSINNHPLASQTIAVVEAYERLVMLENGIKNSNGCAIHSSHEKAEVAATNELLERDAYLRFHYIGQKEGELNLNNIAELGPISSSLAKEKIELKVFKILSNDYGYACAAVANGLSRKKPFGIMVGLGFEPDMETSAKKAVFEVLRFIDSQFSISLKLEPLTFELFHQHKSPGVNEHIMLGLDLKYAQFLHKHYHNLGPQVATMPFPSIKTETMKATLPGIVQPPLFFSRATSTNLIQIEFGKDQSYLLRHFEPGDILQYNGRIATHILG